MNADQIRGLRDLLAAAERAPTTPPLAHWSLPEEWLRLYMALDFETVRALLDVLAVRDQERDAAHQALWDVYGILGFDQDGDPTPRALAYPAIEKLLTDAAKEFRSDYDAACEEACNWESQLQVEREQHKTDRAVRDQQLEDARGLLARAKAQVDAAYTEASISLDIDAFLAGLDVQEAGQ